MSAGQLKRVFLGLAPDGPRRRKRMKFNKLSQLFLVSIIGLFLASLLTSCAIVTIDYVFIADSAGSGTSSAGQIQTYDADPETGALRSGAANVPSGGINPVSLATSSDFANLYVVNKASNNVVHFAIDSGGILTQKTWSLPALPRSRWQSTPRSLPSTWSPGRIPPC